MTNTVPREAAARVLHTNEAGEFTSATPGICSRCEAHERVWLGRGDAPNKLPWLCSRCVAEAVHTEHLVERGMAIVRRLMEEHAP